MFFTKSDMIKILEGYPDDTPLYFVIEDGFSIAVGEPRMCDVTESFKHAHNFDTVRGDKDALKISICDGMFS